MRIVGRGKHKNLAAPFVFAELALGSGIFRCQDSANVIIADMDAVPVVELTDQRVNPNPIR